MQLPPESSEQRSEMLDPHRREERERAATEIAGRLMQMGVDVSSDEDPALLSDLLSAAERFERAVVNQGGDPMVNTPTSTDPQDPKFVIPARTADATLDAYISKVNEAAEGLEDGS